MPSPAFQANDPERILRCSTIFSVAAGKVHIHHNLPEKQLEISSSRHPAFFLQPEW